MKVRSKEGLGVIGFTGELGRAALGFCGLAPGALLRERPSSAVLRTSMKDSIVGWHSLALRAKRLLTSRRIAPARLRAVLKPAGGTALLSYCPCPSVRRAEAAGVAAF
jgi:hypothetical protein